MGLFWSGHLVGTRAWSGDSAVTSLTVSVRRRQVAAATVTQLLSGPGVSLHTETLARVGFVGRYYRPRGSGRHEAVVVWGGSEGGLSDSSEEAALLASHGIPALALAYFDAPGLPCSLTDIRLEYFVKAIRWLRSQPDVDPNRVWLLSGSRGSEAELLVAAHWPGLAHGLIADAPSAIAYPNIAGQCPGPRLAAAWTLHGKPIPYGHTVPTAATYSEPGPHGTIGVSDRPAFAAGLASPKTKAARIPVKSIRGPVLLVSGGDDELWPSDTYADEIMGELGSDPAPHQHLNYTRAGHIVLWLPYSPTTTVEQVPNGTTAALDLGGTPAANNAAHERDWPAMIHFIASH